MSKSNQALLTLQVKRIPHVLTADTCRDNSCQTSSATTSYVLRLQGSIKRDPDGFAEDFEMQWRHYRACMDIFTLKPSNDSREFADLLGFLAQVSFAS